MKTVLPIAYEPITKKDGDNKNDCERNAGKRLLVYLADAFSQRNFLVIEDALASNGPHIELLNELGMAFILGVKPEGNKNCSNRYPGASATGRSWSGRAR
ncbi:hypothetical protein [Granulosicoccus antarcticus]|uniref:hypothetical protein n=1 Tax=Granulosicoccus antarcticus TaxID=437505 RepID=UPI0012FD2D10|nr:hypothetical protein [Granulosicoccus antarcticus]